MTVTKTTVSAAFWAASVLLNTCKCIQSQAPGLKIFQANIHYLEWYIAESFAAYQRRENDSDDTSIVDKQLNKIWKYWD